MKHRYAPAAIRIYLSCLFIACLVTGNLTVHARSFSDNAAAFSPPASFTYYRDKDGDGYGDPAHSTTTHSATPPAGYVTNNTDCDDNDPNVYPGATEYCNGIDDDCDGIIDDNAVDALTWYADVDGDGYGDPNSSILSCDQPDGYVSDNTDCDDTNPDVYPGAPEYCNGIDDDCDGIIDDNAVDASIWYADVDGDGYGDPNSYSYACNQPAGYVSDNTDCDDFNPDVYPGATEFCNGIDDDCDGIIDDNAVDALPWYADADGDGFGDPNTLVFACTAPTGYVSDNTDCDDTNPNVYPGATEFCNGIDDDCDGIIDDNAVDALPWYLDADGDGFGDPNNFVYACSQPAGYVSDNTDCDDTDPNINPGEFEICNGIDDDCNGLIDDNAIDASPWYADADGDGFGDPNTVVFACNQPAGYVSDNSDCDDTNPFVNPGEFEVCNGIDDNCDGLIDNDAIDASPWYVDADGDGFGNPLLVTYSCNQPVGYVSDNTDCNDNDPNINPGEFEVCNGIDDNCDGLIDNDAIDASVWFVDADDDGYGNPLIYIFACNQPDGYVSDNTDCNDSNALINPGAMEICNGIDDNCNGLIDDGASLTATASSNSPICAGSTLNLSADGGTDYSWTGPGGFTSGLPDPSIAITTTDIAGTYSVTVTQGECSATATAAVIVNSCSDSLKLKVFIEGFYQGHGIMTAVLANELVSDDNNVVDTVIVSLVDSAALVLNNDDADLSTVASVSSVLHIDGTLAILLPSGIAGNKYYVRLQHRNAAETWSANPIVISNGRFYDFTTSADSAYGSNQKDVYREGIWSILSGDVNQDGGIDGSDFIAIYPDIRSGAGGYLISDLNGDGGVDGSDFLILYPNIRNGVGVDRP